MTNPSTLAGLDSTSADGIDPKKLWPFKDADLTENIQTLAKIKHALHIGINNGVGFKWCKIRDELSALQDTSEYNKLLCDLTEAALNYLTPIHSTVPKRKGAPVKPSKRMLMFDVRRALENVLGRDVGLHQTQASDENVLCIIESAANAIARLVAESVEVPFPKNVRNHIRKAHSIHSLNLLA